MKIGATISAGVTVAGVIEAISCSMFGSIGFSSSGYGKAPGRACPRA
jgi:hypothetical protein